MAAALHSEPPLRSGGARIHKRRGTLGVRIFGQVVQSPTPAVDRAVAKRVRGFLETNQAAFFDASCERLSTQNVAALLGLMAGKGAGNSVRRVRTRRFLIARDLCSACEADLPKNAVECPKCLGVIEGSTAATAPTESEVDVDDILNQLKKE